MVDLAQFHQVFFEEAFEGLEIMESGLLDLQAGETDEELINTIFRAAHSIKGGSGTFGFTSVSDFTHVMETLLDEMRDGRRQAEPVVVDVLLKSLDCLREMLIAIQDGNEVDSGRVCENQDALNRLLDGETPASGDPAPEAIPADHDEAPPTVETEAVSAVSTEPVEPGWHIAFSPHVDLLKFGNEPLRIFRELESLGELEVSVDDRGLPTLAELDPEEIHLSWDLKLRGAVERAEIDEVFAWVEDECDLAIRSLQEAGAAIATQPEAVAEGVEESAPQPEAEAVGFGPAETKPSAVASPAGKSKKESRATASKQSSGSIRVDTDKIDTLINMVGELVITQSMLSLVGENFELERLEQLQNGLAQLERHTRELQESVMNIRMLPVSFIFSRFPRLVYDLGSKLNKKVELKLSGESTEVDKSVIEMISDPLVHLIRNSMDHGIESPDDRVQAGKPETGTVHLNAFHRGGSIVIEVSDDGRGLDPEKLRAKALEKGLISENTLLSDKQCCELIMAPGFSTAESVSDVSGRGVGMDVVRKNIQALGGNIEIRSEPGAGSVFSVNLPLTLAILDGQSIVVGDEIYIVPLISIIESVSLDEEMLDCVAGHGETFRLRGEYLPIVRMHEVFSVPAPKVTDLKDGLVVVVEAQGVRCGLLVDDLLGQQQVVIKSLEANYRRIDGISGATILGDGSVALILDIPGLMKLSTQGVREQTAA